MQICRSLPKRMLLPASDHLSTSHPKTLAPALISTSTALLLAGLALGLASSLAISKAVTLIPHDLITTTCVEQSDWDAQTCA